MDEQEVKNEETPLTAITDKVEETTTPLTAISENVKEDVLIPTQIQLSETLRTKAKNIGNGKISKGIRIALESFVT